MSEEMKIESTGAGAVEGGGQVPALKNDNEASAALHSIFMFEKRIAFLQQEINDADERRKEKRDSLEVYLRGLNQSDPAITQRVFGFGTIRLKKAPDSIAELPGVNLADYANHQFIVTKITHNLDKRAIVAAVKEGKPMPDFATVIPGDIRFSYQFNDESKLQMEAGRGRR